MVCLSSNIVCDASRRSEGYSWLKVIVCLLTYKTVLAWCCCDVFAVTTSQQSSAIDAIRLVL